VVLLLAVAACGLVATPLAAAGEVPPDDTTTTIPAGGDVDFIPGPDSGAPPEDIGDRGGAGQLALFALVLGGVALIVALVLRESRRARAARDDAGR
jgi:hypothetical protein